MAGLAIGGKRPRDSENSLPAGKNSHLRREAIRSIAKDIFWIRHLYSIRSLFRQELAGEFCGTALAPHRPPARLPLLVPPVALRHLGADHKRQSGRQDGGVSFGAM